MIIDVLNKIPINTNIIKKTKIGKVINHILKANIFDEKLNNETSALVNKWKKMVKDFK